MVSTADKPLTRSLGDLANHPVLAAVEIFQGSMVGSQTAGYARAFQLGDQFRGHTLKGVDNREGVNGAKLIETLRGKYRLEVSVPNVSITDATIKAAVYAVDDDTYSLRIGLKVGHVIQFVSSGIALVEFDTEMETEILSQTVSIGDFIDNANATGYVDLSTALPAGVIVEAVQLDVKTGFTGDTTATAQVGVSGTLDRFTAEAPSVLAAAVKGTGANATSAKQPYVSAATTPRVTVTGASNFGLISAGEMDVKIAYKRSLVV